MTPRAITPQHVTDEALCHLYTTAFPRDEQIGWHELMLLVGTMPLDFTAYYDDLQLVGFTIVYPRPSFNWFWYFAVKDELRGKGLGQQILSMLLEKYKGQTNILDMESPDQVCSNSEQRKRRHAFYLRNGFRDTGVVRTFDQTDMTIMMSGSGTFTMADYDTVLDELNTHRKNLLYTAP